MEPGIRCSDTEIRVRFGGNKCIFLGGTTGSIGLSRKLLLIFLFESLVFRNQVWLGDDLEDFCKSSMGMLDLHIFTYMTNGFQRVK